MRPERSARGLRSSSQEVPAEDDPPLFRRVKHRALAAGVAGSAPYYRRQLRNREFSIISNDCWGAEVYQHLGLAYRTPFVGLFVAAPCFLRLLADLQRYLASPLEFREQSAYADLERDRQRSALRYPLGMLGGDVELHFVHFSTRREAREKWDRRVGRVDYDNLYLKLTADKDMCTPRHVEAFDSLPNSHKLCLTLRPYPHVDSAIRVPGYVSNGSTMYRVCLPHVNVLRWLNGGAAQRRRPELPHLTQLRK
jgi:uncharacterized protein (DUF1919 family)